MLPQAVPTLSNPFGDAALLMALSGPYSTGNMIYPPTGNNTNDASFSMPMQPPVFPFQFSMPFQPDQLLLLQQQQQQLLLQQQQLLNWRNFAFPSTGIPAPAPQPEPTVTYVTACVCCHLFVVNDQVEARPGASDKSESIDTDQVTIEAR